MYRTETVDVTGSPMPVLVFEPEGAGGNDRHPGLVIAQHLPIAHAGLEKDPFQIDVGERYAAAGYCCVIPFLFHWWPVEADIDVNAIWPQQLKLVPVFVADRFDTQAAHMQSGPCT